MTSVPLMETAVINLNALGNGTARIGPRSSREIWSPSKVSVKVNSNPVNEASCNTYMGSDTSQSNFRDSTFSGSSGDSTDTFSADIIKCGFYVWAVWSGGDANVQATLTVTGTKDI